MSARRSSVFLLLLLFAVSCGLTLNLCLGQQSPATLASSGGCGCSHGHDDHDHHDHNHGHQHSHDESKVSESKRNLLPEELAEEEDLKLYGFGSTHDHYLHHHSHDHGHSHTHSHDQSSSVSHLSGAGLWLYAMGCSLLVSLASLICLILLPLMFAQGKPSKLLVDSLALFGAGAMLGDAFLHQMPHAYGGGHSHSHDHSDGHDHSHSEVKHAHSLKDLSVGLSVLAGIVLFLIVEKLVRYIEEVSGDSNLWGHTHHHHHKKSKKPKGNNVALAQSSEDEKLDPASKLNSKKQTQSESGLKKRKKKATQPDEKAAVQTDEKPVTGSVSSSLGKQEPARPSSNLVFGYLNLFSDGVHNFTDGMALGSAFLLHGSVGGWSRTLFLLAHELPQEIGDFGILVRSGFSVSKALFFNFLSALVALAGTALALLLGQDPGHSSLIEGFTAGGFIYIAVAGVLAEMNNSGSSAWKSTVIQLVALTSGMAVALGISLVE